MLDQYRKHVAERAAEGVPPKPLDAAQTAALVELIKQPPAGEQDFLLDLLANRIPAGVDEAAYVKAGFLAAVAKGEVEFADFIARCGRRNCLARCLAAITSRL